MKILDQFITIPETAKLFGVSRPRVHQLIASGKLVVAAWIGNNRLLRRSDVMRFKPKIKGTAGRPKGAANSAN